jgi:putative membrane protein
MRTGSLLAALTAAAILISGTAAGAADQPAVPALGAKDYVTKAAIGDLFEIESSNLALNKSKDKAVQDFAQMMVRDHTDSSNKIKAAVAGNADLAPPSKLDPQHETMLKQLKDADAQAFDNLYVQMQTAGHSDALTLHQTYAASGDNQALRKVAADIVPVVQMHMKHLETMTAAK